MRYVVTSSKSVDQAVADLETARLASLSDSPELKRVAEDVELAITRMIDAAK
jgi:hypothetical protein